MHWLTLIRTDLTGKCRWVPYTNGALYEQTDGVAMGSALGALLADAFISSLEEKLELEGKLPDYYRRYVDITTLPQLRTS